jgi:hypothetical protein
MRPSNLRMVREDWYGHLAAANRRILEASERIENQKALTRSLIEKGYSTERALALLRLFEETLQLMYGRREIILEKVRTYRLALCDQHDLRCVTQTTCDGLENTLNGGRASQPPAC